MRITIALALVLGTAACSTDATQLVVWVDSNFDVPAELDNVRATVRDSTGNITSTHDFALAAPANLPFSFGVSHRGGDLGVSVELEAQQGGSTIFTRRAVTRFTEEKTLLLPMYLAEQCRTLTCDANFSCTQNGCEPDEFLDLREIQPGDENSLSRDAGVSSSPDAGDPNKAGIVVAPINGLRTGEDGTTATFTVQLDREPSSYVAIGISTSDPNEGVTDVSTLTFTPLDWNIPKEVVVRGLDDALHDGDRTYFIRTSTSVSGEPLFDGINPPDVEVVNADNDLVSIELIGSTGLSTTERMGSATFTARLTTEPSAEVVLAITSSDETEGRVLTPSISIMPAQWMETFEITIEGVDDEEADEAQLYQIIIDPSASPDPEYAALPPVSVEVSNADDETPGITVTPTGGLFVDESGTRAQFSVVLNTMPSAEVSIDFESDNILEGLPEPTRLTFNSSNWLTPQTVEVVGQDEIIADGPVMFQIVSGAAVSGDSDYSGMASADVTVINRDDDVATISVTPESGLVTTEAGGTAEFEVVLGTEPTADVTIAVSSDNPNEGTVEPTALVFTSANWRVPQIVTVRGANDQAEDGAVAYTIRVGPITSDDAAYAAIDPADVMATNADDDAAGVTVAPNVLQTREASAVGSTFVVFLNTQPTADVTIDLMSTDLTEGTVAPASVTFTRMNWMTPQTVVVTGVNDSLDDGDIAYQITTSAVRSTDPDYTGLAVSDISAVNVDDDTAQIQVTPTAGLVTTEAGATATFTVRLSSEPTASVTLPLVIVDLSEGTVDMAQVVLDSQNWSRPITVTVRGVDDNIDDGDVTYTIFTGAASSADSSYSGLNPANISATNRDDADEAGISVISGILDTTRESGSSVSFSVVLTSEPTANVTMPFTGDTTEANITGAPLVFTPGNWNIPQEVVVTGIDDNILDGDITWTLRGQAIMSTDAAYAAFTPVVYSFNNIDDGALPATSIATISNNQIAESTAGPAISADGRIVAFTSQADLAGDTNGLSDIYLFDRSDLSTERVTGGRMMIPEPNGASGDPNISADGRYVVFTTESSNLDTASNTDSNTFPDVYLFDRAMNSIELMSRDASGASGAQPAIHGNISASGNYVVFASDHSFTGVDDDSCIFVRDRTAGTITRGGISSVGACFDPAISDDGRWVVFSQGARTASSVFLYDRQLGSQSELQAMAPSATDPGITPDGRYIWFTAVYDEMEPAQIYRYDRSAGGPYEQLCLNAAGVNADAPCGFADFADGGSVFTFTSGATNLGAPASSTAIYARDHLTSVVSQLFLNSNATTPAISGDGRFITANVPVNTSTQLFLISR